MTASATAISTDMTQIPACEEDADRETEAAELDQSIVIKLEPESDPEDLPQSSILISTHPSSANSNNREAEGCDLDGRFTQCTIENGIPTTTDNNFPGPVKAESDLEDCSLAVFPVRAFRNDHGSAREDRGLLQQDTFLESTLFGDASDDGSMLFVAGRGRGGSTVSRRKLSVSRRLPILCLTPRTKKKKKKAKTENRQLGEQVLAAMGEEGQGKAMETEYGSLIPPPKPDKPVVSPSNRGRKRNLKPPSLVCGVCGMTFRWPSRYNDHLRRHSGERPYICKECGDAFTSSSYLRIHSRKHSGLLPYPCVICGEAFHQAHLLTEHRRRHAQEGAFTCGDCGLQCWSPSALSKHRQTVHPENPSNKPFVCGICPAAFQRSYHLETHMRSHTGEKPFKCNLCSLAYTTQGSLKVHMRTHTGERPFACSECSRAFITSGQLKKHSRTHNRPVVTVSNDSNTVYVQKLKSVTPVQEEEKKEDGCHLKLEIQCFPKDSTYSCDICKEVFVRSIDLASHMRHDHPKPVQKENICRECGQVFSRPHTLKVHLRSHAGIRPFKCETCGKQFTQRSILNAHLRSHSQAKPFKCSVCGASYSSAKYRQIHMKIHGEIRPNECIVCGSTFSSNTALTNHLRTHNHSEVAAAIAVSGAVKESFKAPSDSSAPQSETKGKKRDRRRGKKRSGRLRKTVTDSGDHPEQAHALVNSGTDEHTPGKADQSTNDKRPKKKRKKAKTNSDLRSVNETRGVTGSDPAKNGDGGAEKDRPQNTEPDCKAVDRTELPDPSEEREGAQAGKGHQEREERGADQGDHLYSSDTETEYDP